MSRDMSKTLAALPDLKNQAGPPPLRKWWPALGIVALMVAAYVFGLHGYLSLETVAQHRDLLKAFVADHLVTAIALFMAAYVAIVALSLPGAAVMSIAGGFLFGWMIGAPVVIAAATLGAVIVFEAVKSSLGHVFAERSGPFMRKLSGGFAEDAFSYLLFLRLVPAFPFFAVNAVAGLCKVRLRTFLAATVIGIIPASLAFTWLGTGLDSIIDAQAARYRDCLASGEAECVFDLELGSLLTREIVLAFAALGVVALLPVALKHWRRRRCR